MIKLAFFWLLFTLINQKGAITKWRCAIASSDTSSETLLIAQSCPEEELHAGEEASKIMRRVKLPKFGIEISVPENYRVMLRNTGEVEVLHPQDYALWRCNMEGRGYGRGYYSEYISLTPRNSQLSL